MGETIRPGTGIRDFTPDNDVNTLYVRADNNSLPLLELIDRINDHFGPIDHSTLTIEAEYIHTECLGYDRYDSGDYTNYIVVRRQV